MKLINYLFTVKGKDPLDEQRRQLLNIILIISTSLGLAFGVATIIGSDILYWGLLQRWGTIGIALSAVAIVLVSALIFVLNRKLGGFIPGFLYILLICALITSSEVPEQLVAGRGLLGYAIPVVLSSFLLMPSASFILSGILFIALSIASLYLNKPPELVSMSIYFILSLHAWLIARILSRTLRKLSATNRALAQELAKTRDRDYALEESRVRSQAIFENTMNSVFLVGDNSAIVDVNPAACKLTGYSKEELINRKIWSLIDDLSIRTRNSVIRKAIGTGRIRGSSRLKSKTGKIISFDFMGVINILPGIHLAVMWDTTERLDADRALKASRELLGKTLESLNAAILVIDARTEMIVDTNKAATSIFGFEPGEMIGRTPELLHINPASYDTFRAHVLAAENRGKHLHDFFYKMKKKDGTIFPTEHTVAPILDEKGIVTGWVVVIRDITERKKLEEQVVHSQKMEALGRLAGGITHDFNNILTTIFGYCDIARMNPEIDPMSKEHLAEIKKAAERAAALTSQLLAFSRKQMPSPKTVMLNDLVCNMKNLLKRLVVEDIALEYKLAPGIDSIRVDPVQIEQIIVNIVVNACDAIEHGGTITIETANCYLDENFAENHPGLEPGNYVMLGISDTGRGMDEMTIKRAFDPFFTTKQYGKGTGMSLSIVFGIVKQSGGHIHVYSELDRGTTFKLYFPKDLDTLGAVNGKSETGERSLHGKERIMVVEDDVSLRTMMTKTLVSFGYSVRDVENGKDALAVFGNDGRSDYDLVITDVIMPGMSGKEVADSLRVRFPNLRIIFISGYTDTIVINHGIENSEKLFLQKPFSPDELARKVRSVLDG
jgi:two-component system, cell cycle sensor histidine kinase and response regulator CckA